MASCSSHQLLKRLFGLENKIVLVTGASSGLGRHFSKTLAGAGAQVAVAARRKPLLEEVVEEIKEDGGTAAAFELDVTKSESIRDILTAVSRHFGGITTLVNNAGIGLDKPAFEVTEDEWNQVIATNLTGPWLLAQHTAKQMAQAGGGNIINISSILSHMVTPRLSAYCAAKAGLSHLTKQLAVEWAPQNIRVNAICPGYVITDINREFFSRPIAKKIISRIPQQRVGEVEDLDAAMLMLAGDGSQWMTGSDTGDGRDF